MTSRLEAVRRQRGLSRPAVAARLGVSEKTIYRMEKGKTEVKRVHLLALAEVYGVEVEDLVDNGRLAA
jgi:transcriptional regulator with XRE-family HTH domain